MEQIKDILGDPKGAYLGMWEHMIENPWELLPAVKLLQMSWNENSDLIFNFWVPMFTGDHYAVGNYVGELAAKDTEYIASYAVVKGTQYAVNKFNNHISALNSATKINIDDAQFGKKIGKHAKDYGLDPADPSAREFLREKIYDIHGNPTEIKQGDWMGLAEGSNSAGLANFYIQGNDVVVTDMNGTFVTILKDGINNLRVKNADTLWPKGR